MIEIVAHENTLTGTIVGSVCRVRWRHWTASVGFDSIVGGTGSSRLNDFRSRKEAVRWVEALIYYYRTGDYAKRF